MRSRAVGKQAQKKYTQATYTNAHAVVWRHACVQVPVLCCVCKNVSYKHGRGCKDVLLWSTDSGDHVLHT